MKVSGVPKGRRADVLTRLKLAFGRFGMVDGCEILDCGQGHSHGEVNKHYWVAVLIFANPQSCRRAAKERVTILDQFGSDKRLKVEPFGELEQAELKHLVASQGATDRGCRGLT